MIKSCLLPRLSFFITWCTPCDLIPRLPGSHSSTLIILGALHAMKVASFPDSCSQIHVPSLIPRLVLPASFPDSYSQPHFQTGAPSLIPRLMLPNSFPDSCSQPHPQTRAPRLVLPASFTGPSFHCLQSGFHDCCTHPFLNTTSDRRYQFLQTSVCCLCLICSMYLFQYFIQLILTGVDWRKI